jgi:hypothetical protein
VIGVREPIRARPRPRDDRPLLEGEHRLGRTHEREKRLDRLPALRVRHGMRLALGDRELHTLVVREPGQQRRGLREGSAKLDVRRAAQREGARAEERAAKVRSPTAATTDHAPWRAVERPVSPVDDARGGKDPQSVVVPVDVELVARRRVERSAAVRADLGPDSAVAQKGERTSGRCAAPEVEVERPVSRPAKMEAPRRVEQCRELGSAVALALRRDRRELLPDVLGRDQRTTPSSASSRRLTSSPAAPYPPMPSAATTR